VPEDAQIVGLSAESTDYIPMKTNSMRYSRLGIAICFSLLVQLGAAAVAEVLNITAFGAKPDGSDTTPCVRAALEQIRQGNVEKLVFPPGRYDFWPDQAEEQYLFISNNDEGLKRIAFVLAGVKDLEIDGGGAMLVFHGRMMPFLIEHSQGVTLKNFSLDYRRPFQSEGKVLAITNSSVDLEFSEEFPYAIRNGVLVFTDGQKSSGPQTTVKSGEVLYDYGSLLAFDPVKHETAFMAKDRYGLGSGVVAQPIGPRQVRVTLDKVSATAGDILVFSPKMREFPGVVISDSSGVHLSGVTIHHSGGMGIIAQRSADIFLKQVRVTPPPGGKRIVSTTADATHFVNCRGKIEMEDCVFEQQKDDATNVHGLYARIMRILAPNRLEVRLIHPQQAGVDFVKPGTRLELTQGPSMQTLGYAKVKAVQRLNKESTIVETEQPLHADIKPGDCVADADANTAEVLIKNCLLRGNRARGILLGSRGRMVIENNTFHIPGAAILFEGDARFWFEQSGVRDVVIRGNTFDNCNYGVWGQACIDVKSGIADEFKKTTRYNRNITIENNLFRVFSPLPLLSVYSVDGLTFRNNRLERTQAYPAGAAKPGPVFDITDSDHVKVEPPLLAPKQTGLIKQNAGS
jgi:hypothetical protein